MGMVWLTWSHQQAPHCSTSSKAPVSQLPLHAAARPRATRRPAHVSARRALSAPSAAFAAGIIHVKMGCARVALASPVCQARIQDDNHLSHHLKGWHLQPVPHEFFKPKESTVQQLTVRVRFKHIVGDLSKNVPFWV